MDLVKWSQRTAEGAVKGVMAADKVQEELLHFGKVARDVMRETGSDHVLYGMKIFSEGKLKTVHFYMWPMSDGEFKRITGHVSNSMIYAVHKS